MGKNPSTKRCVGSPPRQTEDPLSPPCVAYFEGDNFGATYPGVTKDEIRVLFYFTGGAYAGTSEVQSDHPANSYWDLGAPASESEPMFPRLLRAYQRYFNDRYQTYNRKVRFFVRFAINDQQTPPEVRRSDAIADVNKVKPFAVISEVTANADAYISEMNRRGVVVFLGNPSGGSAGSALVVESSYQKRAPLLWSHVPSVDQYADMFVSYVCKKVIGHPVSFSGNASQNGQPRRLGLLRVTDPTRPDKIAMGKQVEAGIRKCGGTFVATGTIPFDNGSGGIPEQSAAGNQNGALFIQNQVTTIIQAGGGETFGGTSKSLNGQGYRPEWVLLGDGVNDTNIAGSLHDQGAWFHARAVSFWPRITEVESQACFQAAREADPSLQRVDVKNWSCTFYPDLQTMFTGIQVAGPRLTPQTIDQGFHAIPAVQSGDPAVPACFFEPGDYTCVKDAMVAAWDPGGTDPQNGAKGCWRPFENGRRYLKGRWPGGNVEEQRRVDDTCNAQGFNLT